VPRHHGTSHGGTSAGHTGGFTLKTSGREIVPALGLAWANCVNTRVLLSKESTLDGQHRIVHKGPPSQASLRATAAGAAPPPAASPQLRHMQVVFSPFLPQSKCSYVVESTGMRGLHPLEVLPAVEDGFT
jgi:DNA-repair protein XRCC3